MNPSLAAVSAFGLRAPETFETAISAGAWHMAQNDHASCYHCNPKSSIPGRKVQERCLARCARVCVTWGHPWNKTS